MVRIGVEPSLSDVEQALQARGYQVIPLQHEEDVKECDCCVVTDQHENTMGISDTITSAPIISAQGMSANEICEKVENKVGH